MSPRALRIVPLALAAGLALSGCSVLEGVIGGGGNVFELAVGDCLNDRLTGEDEVNSVPVVDCNNPHDSEIFFSHQMDEGSYPGVPATTELADRVCSESFEDFIGLPYDESALYMSYFYPTETSWSNGDREILCIVYDQDAQVTGTLEDARR